jgi:class 3 adenylate cyclase/tetratricopeptide (TPR) repeat protein
MGEVIMLANNDNHVAGYIPKWVRALVDETVDAADTHAWASPRPAAVLLLDIAGFTEITNQFAQDADRGAEHLSELLNDCFAILTDVVEAFGGDIVAFTGDGFLVVWDAGDRVQSTHIAAQCALALREAMDQWAQLSNSGIRQRISVDVGTVYYCRLGGHGGVWRYAVVGTPFDNVGVAYRKSGIGEVALCESAWRVLADHCNCEEGQGVFRLNRLNSKLEVAPAPQTLRADSARLQGLLPKVVIDRLRMGSTKWLAEFRNVSVLCISFLGATVNETLVEFLQPCISLVQRTASRFEGTIFTVSMDDKGICVALVFGAPPLAHEDDALRAIEAALAIHEELKRLSISASIGIGSGRLFCGDYGGRSRREYGVLGPAINMAARLMEIADGEILCGAATAEAVRDRVSFVLLQPQHVKGRSAPIQTFRPVRMLSRQQVRYAGEMIGRDEERCALREKLAAARTGTGGFVLVQGEPGIGKSRLLSDLAEFAQDEGIRIARGYASAIDRSTPYFAWRQVLSALIEPELASGDRLSQYHLAERFQHDTTLVSWLPLLRDVLPIALTETPLTVRITGAARAASIEALFVELLRSPVSPRAIILEDLHWFDEASLSMLKGILRRSPQLLVVASRRSPGPYFASETRAGNEGVLEINLGQLPPDAVAEIAKRRLRATQLSPALTSFVQTRTDGNPFYCEEFVSALRDAGAISVERGVGGLNAGSPGSARMILPASLEGVIVARVDVLRPDEQLLLKASSAVGGPFTAELLRSVYPADVPLHDIRAMLDGLVARELLRIVRTRAGSEYQFRHAVSEEVTYNLLSFAQRQLLHAAIATAFEKDHAGRLEPLFGQLARHWEFAGEKLRAIEYLERAAEQALRSHANHDAIQYVDRAFELSDGGLSKDGNLRFARWETLLGDAYNELADFDRSLPHYERALTLLGQRIARKPSERAIGLITHVTEQAWLRLASPRLVRLKPVDQETSHRVAHVRERLAERHFFRNESTAVLDETLAAVNFAERGGAVTEVISGYSALAIGLGMSGLLRPARFYRDRAMSLAGQFEPTPEAARAYMLAAVLEYGLGGWEESERFAKRSLSLYRQLGDRARARTVLTVLASGCILRGDIDEADRLQREASEDVELETLQGTAWRLAAKVMISTIRGRVEPDDLQQLSEIGDAKLVSGDQLLCLGTLAAGYLQCDAVSKALIAADRGLGLLRDTGILWGNYIYGASGVIEVYLACWAMKTSSAVSEADVRNKALLACECARRSTRHSPVCRPRALLLSGRAASLSGKSSRARKLWTDVAASAEKLHLRRERALALYEIGRATDSRDPCRRSSLSRAAEIFEAIGADADLAATRLALSS